MAKGIDVSSWQGAIDWPKVKLSGRVDFAIIRAGYGKNNADNQAVANAAGCRKNNIPFGVYWFSYAYNEEMAKDEADYACDFAEKFGATLPIAYDWEEDSENYAKKNGVVVTDDLRKRLALAFLKEVKRRGKMPMLYANWSDILGAYKTIYKDFYLWYSAPDVDAPGVSCDFWQNSWNGRVTGISGDVDTDIAYTDFGNTNTNNISEEQKKKIVDKLVKQFGDTYITAAYDTIIGKYSTGNERRKMIESLGLDYDIVQSIVNYILLGR